MNYDQKAYWVWMQNAFGSGSSKPHRILCDYKTPKDFYEAGKNNWLLLGFLTQKEYNLLCDYSLDEATAVVEYCEKVGQQVITPQSEEYPECLKNIHNPPCVLYVKGKLPQVDFQPSIAVVGTRDATSSGIQIAFEFGFQLAKAGAVVVSGGAKGIDTAAHKGALQAGGKTVCVLGCGIDYNYLMGNASLRSTITHSGAVVSEYPFNTPPSKINFPIRNRIISGLSVGTLVVEAAAKSGSLITANLALEQGKDVFAIPCGIDNPVSEGVNNLIKIGAKPVSNAQEILEEYQYRYQVPAKTFMQAQQESFYFNTSLNQNENKQSTQLSLGNEFSQNAKKVYEHLTEKPTHIAELSQLTELTAAQTLSAITELELSDKIVSRAGRKYSLPLKR